MNSGDYKLPGEEIEAKGLVYYVNAHMYNMYVYNTSSQPLKENISNYRLSLKSGGKGQTNIGNT